MEVRKTSKLPDGVGKKIIEALRKQSGSPDEIFEEESSNLEQPVNSGNGADFEDNMQSSEELSWDQEEQDDDFYKTIDVSEFDDFKLDSEKEYNSVEEFNAQFAEGLDFEEEEPIPYNEYVNKVQESPYEQNPLEEEEVEAAVEEPVVYEEPVYEEEKPAPKKPAKKAAPVKASEVQEPVVRTKPAKQQYVEEDSEIEENILSLDPNSNVAILMHLISRLPAGVTKQTGAQIIRQTLEAMGISMSKVLTEAQQYQDELSLAIRNDINTIEEYRNNIRSLEKQVQDHKKQSEEMEDLISLFIMPDKNHKR